MGVSRTGPADVNRKNFYGLASDYRKTTSDMGTIGIEHDFSDRLTLRNMTRYTYSTQKYVWTQPDDSQGNVLNGRVWRRANTRDSRVDSLANQTELVGKFDTGSFKHSFNVGLEVSKEEGKKDSIAVNRGTGSGKDNACNFLGAASKYNCTSLYDPDPHDPWVNTLDGERVGQPTRSRTISKSLYAFDTVELSPQWLVNGGLRLDRYETKFTNTPANNYTVIKRNDTLWNYQLGLVYKPADNGSIYVSYATSSAVEQRLGRRRGQWPGSWTRRRRRECGRHGSRKEQDLRTRYQVGSAGSPHDADGRGVSHRDHQRAPDLAGQHLRDGGQEAGRRLRTRLLGQHYAGLAGLRRLHLPEEQDQDDGVAADKGNDFPNTPRNAFNIWSTYAVTPDFTVGGGAYYVDKQYGNTANTAYIPSYWRFDAMAGYRFNKNWNMQLNVFNLFDKTYYDKAYAAHYVSVAPGRSAILSVNMRY